MSHIFQNLTTDDCHALNTCLPLVLKISPIFIIEPQVIFFVPISIFFKSCAFLYKRSFKNNLTEHNALQA